MAGGFRLLMILALFALAPAAAEAAFPGENGKIAFTSDEGAGPSESYIWTMNPDGTNRVQLTSGPVYDRSPAWSPDGRRIAFSRSVATGQSDIYVMNADGSGLTALTDAPFHDSGPSWSPDGSRIVFWTNRDHQFGDDLWTMAEDGSDERFLLDTGGIDEFPAWSPAGDLIVFTVASTPPTQGLWTVRPDGSGAARLTSGANTRFAPDWSPDTTRIAYDQFSRIGVLNADGTGNRFLTGQSNYFPAWAPDGSQIAFSGQEPDALDIRVMDADGSGQHPVVVLPGDQDQPDWQPIPVDAYPRPKAASPVKVALVPAYEPCTTPNRRHGPPLDHDSCHPPTRSSAELTFGTADSNGKPTNGRGLVKYIVRAGNPSTPADEADVQLVVDVRDVYLSSSLTDYTGELRVRTAVRITDKLNGPHPGGPGAGTVSVATLSSTLLCASSDAARGASCHLTTTLDALVPGIVPEGKRSIWELDQVQVDDGGADGDADTTDDNSRFMVQGVFVP